MLFDSRSKGLPIHAFNESVRTFNFNYELSGRFVYIRQLCTNYAANSTLVSHRELPVSEFYRINNLVILNKAVLFRNFEPSKSSTYCA